MFLKFHKNFTVSFKARFITYHEAHIHCQEKCASFPATTRLNCCFFFFSLARFNLVLLQKTTFELPMNHSASCAVMLVLPELHLTMIGCNLTKKARVLAILKLVFCRIMKISSVNVSGFNCETSYYFVANSFKL